MNQFCFHHVELCRNFISNFYPGYVYDIERVQKSFTSYLNLKEVANSSENNCGSIDYTRQAQFIHNLTYMLKLYPDHRLDKKLHDN